MELSLMHLEIQSVDKLIEPKAEVKTNEQIIGHPSDYAKKIYTLWMITERESKQVGLELQYGENNETEDLNKQFFKLKSRAKILEELFWYVCREEFDEWNSSVEVRKDWEFVISQNNPLNFLDDMFKNLLGE